MRARNAHTHTHWFAFTFTQGWVQDIPEGKSDGRLLEGQQSRQCPLYKHPARSYQFCSATTEGWNPHLRILSRVNNDVQPAYGRSWQGWPAQGLLQLPNKKQKVYKYVFMFLFNVAITNAYILYKHANAHPKLKNIKEFRLQLAKKLIAQYCSRRRAGRTGGAIVPLQLQHFPLKDWTAPCPSKRRRGRCSHCSERGNRTDTPWYCEEWGVWLCHNGNPQQDCFYLWHKNKEQWSEEQ